MNKLFLLSIIFLSYTIKAQFNCNSAMPFCTGTVYNQSTTSNNTSSSGGMSFGCITNFSQNYFFYSQAQVTGPVTLQVMGTTDMDLIIWGGVNGPQNICSQLMTNTLACVSSPSISESLAFNVIAGQYYLLCATSTATASTQFTLNQSGGTGAMCVNACSKAVATPSICYVTSNNNLNNEIYFNNYTNSFKKGTVIYRENSSSLWDSIGYVPNGQPDKFIDLTSNTNQQSYRYAIAHLDSCNNIQLKSAIHKTILLQSSLGTGTQINLSWNLYQGLVVSSYYIFRGTTTNNMQVINTVSGSTTAYTDLTPPTGTNLYKIAITTPTNCSSSAAPLDTIISSNYKMGSTTVGIKAYESDYIISLYPNPASNLIHVQTRSVAENITLTDLTGKKLFSQKPKSVDEIINLENLSSGIYFIKVSINDKIYYRKIIVNNEVH